MDSTTGKQIPDCYDMVGAGWRAILEKLHADLTRLFPEYQVFQVKEKFGGLRVYLLHEYLSHEGGPGVDDQVRAAINVAESQSYLTCEVCGEPGSRHETALGWQLTLCDADAKKRGCVKIPPDDND